MPKYALILLKNSLLLLRMERYCAVAYSRGRTIPEGKRHGAQALLAHLHTFWSHLKTRF